MLTLQVFNYQTGEQQEHHLNPQKQTLHEWMIGRIGNCDIVLGGLEVSRIHGRIDYLKGAYYFSDLGSTDGSRINN